MAITLAVVIPVYQGEKSVATVVEALRVLAKTHRLCIRVVLVEDGSTDGSREAVLALATGTSGVTAVMMEHNVGQQQALYIGLAYAMDCDVLATMDCDGAHPAALLPTMLNRIRQGAALCYAVPRRRNYRLYRRFGTLLRDAIFRVGLGMPSGVRVSAYRVMTRELAQNLAPEPDGYLYLSMATARLRPATVCLTYDAPPSRRTSYTLAKLLRLYVALLIHATPLARLMPRRRQTPPAHTVQIGRGWLWQD